MKMTLPSIISENNNNRLNSHQSAWFSNWSCSLKSCSPALPTLLRSLFCSSVRFCNEMPDSILCFVIEFHQVIVVMCDQLCTFSTKSLQRDGKEGLGELCKGCRDFQWIFGRISSESPPWGTIELFGESYCHSTQLSIELLRDKERQRCKLGKRRRWRFSRQSKEPFWFTVHSGIFSITYRTTRFPLAFLLIECLI